MEQRFSYRNYNFKKDCQQLLLVVTRRGTAENTFTLVLTNLASNQNHSENYRRNNDCYRHELQQVNSVKLNVLGLDVAFDIYRAIAVAIEYYFGKFLRRIERCVNFYSGVLCNPKVIDRYVFFCRSVVVINQRIVGDNCVGVRHLFVFVKLGGDV